MSIFPKIYHYLTICNIHNFQYNLQMSLQYLYLTLGKSIERVEIKTTAEKSLVCPLVLYNKKCCFFRGGGREIEIIQGGPQNQGGPVNLRFRGDFPIQGGPLTPLHTMCKNIGYKCLFETVGARKTHLVRLLKFVVTAP